MKKIIYISFFILCNTIVFAQKPAFSIKIEGDSIVDCTDFYYMNIHFTNHSADTLKLFAENDYLEIEKIKFSKKEGEITGYELIGAQEMMERTNWNAPLILPPYATTTIQKDLFNGFELSLHINDFSGLVGQYRTRTVTEKGVIYEDVLTSNYIHVKTVMDIDSAELEAFIKANITELSEMQKNPQAVRNGYETFLRNFPNGKLEKKARARLAIFYSNDHQEQKKENLERLLQFDLPEQLAEIYAFALLDCYDNDEIYLKKMTDLGREDLGKFALKKLHSVMNSIYEDKKAYQKN